MRIAIAITLTMVSFYVATDIYTPSMPTIATDLKVSRDKVQETLTLFLLGSCVCSLFSGVLADHFGKRRILSAGLSIAIAGSVIAVFCATIEWMMFARLLQGMGGVTANIIGLSIIHDQTPEEKSAKLFGIMGIYFALVPALAPVAGGFINAHLGWRYNFYVMLFLFVISAIAIYWGVPKDPTRKSSEGTRFCWHAHVQMFKHAPFVSILLIGGSFCSAEWFIISYLPFYLQEQLLFTPQQYGLFLGLMIPWFAVGSYIADMLNKRWGYNKVTAFTLVLAAITAIMYLLVAFLYPYSSALIYIGFSIFLVAFGIIYPLAAHKIMGFFPQKKATATSLRSLVSVIFSYIGVQCAEIANEEKFSHCAFAFCMIAVFSSVLFIARGRLPENG